MEIQTVDGVEVEVSSGNLFADLGLPDAGTLKIKSDLLIKITRAVRNLGLSQEEAGHKMCLHNPDLSYLFRGNLTNLSEHKLMDCLNRLGYDIEITIKPSTKSIGHWIIAA